MENNNETEEYLPPPATGSLHTTRTTAWESRMGKDGPQYNEITASVPGLFYYPDDSVCVCVCVCVCVVRSFGSWSQYI